MFKCDNSQCISYVWWCDGDRDCHDGSDEKPNCIEKNCKAGYIKCNETGRCYPESWQCDGDADCGDDSDESPDVCGRWLYCVEMIQTKALMFVVGDYIVMEMIQMKALMFVVGGYVV
jgi:hypothetical protein